MVILTGSLYFGFKYFFQINLLFPLVKMYIKAKVSVNLSAFRQSV